MFDQLLNFKNLAITLVAFILVYIAVKKLLERQSRGHRDRQMINQIILVSIFTVGAIAVILAIPMSETTRTNVTQLMGIVISAVLALSSSTFIGNALAGVLLRFVGSHKPGDIIRIDHHFGKITERGLFHTEIQTDNSDLMTLPNLYLTTKPVEVIRSSGTIISTTVSLGYDVSRLKIEKCLLSAAKLAGLKNTFIYITELGDYSVSYKINGLLDDTGKILITKSNLNGKVLDKLHEAGIEIVSPTFMNQRPIAGQVFIPSINKQEKASIPTSEDSPEAIVFDKAVKAESIEKRKQKREELDKKIETLRSEIKVEKDDKKKDSIKKQIEQLKKGRDELIEKIDTTIKDFEQED